MNGGKVTSIHWRFDLRGIRSAEHSTFALRSFWKSALRQSDFDGDDGALERTRRYVLEYFQLRGG